MTRPKTENNIGMAQWTRTVEATIAASIYALPPSERVQGAIAAHAAGYWVHADVILKQAGSGKVVNIGVDVKQIKECLEQAPGLRMDIHLMVIPGTLNWEPTVDRVVAELAEEDITRWSASSGVMDRVSPSLTKGTEQWIEVWPQRDGRVPQPAGVGVLTMLIEPGTQGEADMTTLEVVALLSKEANVGVDGGVTPSVASTALAAGAGYLVIGRALFARD